MADSLDGDNWGSDGWANTGGAFNLQNCTDDAGSDASIAVEGGSNAGMSGGISKGGKGKSKGQKGTKGVMGVIGVMGGMGSMGGKGLKGGKGFKGKGKEELLQVPGATVFIFHVPVTWDEEELQRHFQHCGRMINCVVQRKDDGESRGFGFIGFGDLAAARKAVVAMNGFTTGAGKFLSVSIKKGEEQHALPVEAFPPRGQLGVTVPTNTRGLQVPPGATVFLFHLPPDWTEEELHRHFIHFGAMLAITVMRKESGESRGFGFVSFQFPESAKRAVEGMNGFCAGSNRFLKVQFKKGEEEVHAQAAAFAPDSGFVVAQTAPSTSMTEMEGDASVQAVKLCLMECFSEQLQTDPLDGATPEMRETAITAIAAQAVTSTAELLGMGGTSGRTAPAPTAPSPFSAGITSEPSPWGSLQPVYASKGSVRQVKPDANLYVWRIPATWTEDDLHSNFSIYGNILSLRVQRNEDGSSKGFGFVGFDSAEAAQNAINGLNGLVVEGREIVVRLKDGKAKTSPY